MCGTASFGGSQVILWGSGSTSKEHVLKSGVRMVKTPTSHTPHLSSCTSGCCRPMSSKSRLELLSFVCLVREEEKRKEKKRKEKKRKEKKRKKRKEKKRKEKKRKEKKRKEKKRKEKKRKEVSRTHILARTGFWWYGAIALRIATAVLGKESRCVFMPDSLCTSNIPWFLCGKIRHSPFHRL